MKEEINKLIKNTLGEEPLKISEIENFGSVNNVFDIICQSNNYIVRFNKDENKRLEFLKEEWCIKNVKKLGILVPEILHNGVHNGNPFMIQEKIMGFNGALGDKNEKLKIWKTLGEYSLKYNRIKKIEIPELISSEFHKNWRSKLDYNIEQLSLDDSLLKNNAFTLRQHNDMKKALISLRDRAYEIGLTHGDLTPRNVIVNESSIYLLDWGTAEINIVPHSEIGIILIEGEANKYEFKSFLEGMNIGEKEFRETELEIRILNILHRLDKYRWASGYDREHIERYVDKIKQEYKKMIELK